MVLESESGRFFSFGTPEAGPIVDAFLFGDAPTEFDNNKEQKAKITNLQNECFQVEKDKAIGDKSKKGNMMRAKEIQETSRTAKYVYGKVEDLDATELFEMYRELWIKQEIDDRLPSLQHENQVEAVGRLRDPSFLQPTWLRWMPSHTVTLPKYSPWAPSQASFPQHPWKSGGESSSRGDPKSKLGDINFPWY
ncbi:hypothetical protein BAE44_0002469 [Dichanthelium oligosanthes]|uniref:MADS-box domain-containing protein n=1 Tax=Dichanthelium oligosanthes TaxID=888268 RepID=A0A1E5WGJ1_9POAL|nr:hypothetical protein BAE44_0002469 [Dichanthelium oligosanthes]